jgi:alkaline phosphatase D
MQMNKVVRSGAVHMSSIKEVQDDPPPAKDRSPLLGTRTAIDFVVTKSLPHRIAFGSCHKNKYADPRIWRTLQSTHPSAFLWTGDAVYPPVRNIASLEQLETEYDRMLHNGTIGYRDFIDDDMEVFGTWDDHDYGGNDRGADMPQRMERAALFWNFLQRSPPPRRAGLYYSVEWRSGDSAVRVLFLDTRWHRQPHCLPSVAGRFPLGAGIACLSRWLAAGALADYCTKHQVADALLGAEQWSWLEGQIQELPAPNVLLIVSSIQVLTTNPAMESWGHFPNERHRLVRLLRQAGQSSVVTILSGDVHHGEILDPLSLHPSPQSGQNAFLEVTSSGLTHDCSKHIYGKLCVPLLNVFHKHRAIKKDYYIGRNFGTVDIDWEAETVQVQVHDALTGGAVLSTGPRSFRKKTFETYSHISHRGTDDNIGLLIPPCMDNHLLPFLWTAIAGLVIALACWRRWKRI